MTEKLTKTEQSIMDAIKRNGYDCVQTGFFSGRRGSLYGTRAVAAMRKLEKKGLIVIKNIDGGKSYYSKGRYHKYTDFIVEAVNNQ